MYQLINVLCDDMYVRYIMYSRQKPKQSRWQHCIFIPVL